MVISVKGYLSETYKGQPGEGVPVGGETGQVLYLKIKSYK